MTCMTRDELFNALKAFQDRLNATYSLLEAELAMMEAEVTIDKENNP